MGLAFRLLMPLGRIGRGVCRTYREKWKAIVEDVRARGAWGELKMDEEEMRRIERITGFSDWTDPQLSAIYWGMRGRCADIVSQASAIYRKRH